METPIDVTSDRGWQTIEAELPEDFRARFVDPTQEAAWSQDAVKWGPGASLPDA